jgi:hypothetical protein
MNIGPIENLGYAVAQFCIDHPKIGGAALFLAALSLVSSMICSGIRFRYPVLAEMPPHARHVLGFLMPLAVNWWRLERVIGVHDPLPPLSSPPDEKRLAL